MCACGSMNIMVWLPGEDGACFGLGAVRKGEGGGPPLGFVFRFQHLSQILKHCGVRKSADAAPELGRDRAGGSPPLMGEVDQHAGEVGVAALVQALNGPELAADEEGLYHHLVPGL